jgi:hypothetical protein
MSPLLARMERHAPLAAGLALALPVILARYPPMGDLPLHEAIVGVLRHYGDPKYFPEGLYQLNLGEPNQLFYVPAYLVSWVASTATAVKIVVAMAVLSIPLCAARFADYVGVTRWAAVVVSALGLGWMFFWGLVANMIGLAALMYVLPTFDRYLATPTKKGLWASLGGMVLLYLSHEAMMVAACAVFALITVLLPLRPKDVAMRAIPPAFAVLLGVAQVIYQAPLVPTVAHGRAVTYHSMAHKIAIIPGALFAGYEVWVRNTMFAVAMVIVVALGVERWRSRSKEPLGLRERLYRLRFPLVATGLMIAYFAAPLTANAATLIYHRFLPPAFVIFVISLSAPREGPHVRVVPRLSAAAVPLASLLTAWPSFADANVVTQDLDHVMSFMEYREATCVVELGPVPQYRLFHPETMAARIVAERGGRYIYDYTTSSISPAILARKHLWYDTITRLSAESDQFRPKHDFRRFRYMLLHTTNREWGIAAGLVMKKEAHLVAYQGEWFLYESDLPRIGLLDDDVPYAPEELAATIHLRLLRFFDKLLKEGEKPENPTTQ